MGTVLVPGGNDSLILFGLPLLWPLLKPYLPGDMEARVEAGARGEALRRISIAALGAATLGLMVGLGFYFIAFFALAFWLASRQQLDRYRWFLKVAFWSLPLPWLAIEAGWLIAEYGRQPWIIDGVLPTFLAASGLKLHQILITLCGFVLIYTVLAVIEVWLMRKLILKGPEHLSAPAPDAPAPQPALAG